MIEGRPRVAVAFSGGLDSSIIAWCAKGRTGVVACTAFAEGSHDSRTASLEAASLGIKLVATKLTRETVVSELREMELPFRPSLMDRSLWCLYSVVSRKAAKSGAEVILLGQLADELFGGYAKYQAALSASGEEAAVAMMERDLREYEARGRRRDVNACSKWLEPRFPFADKEVIDLGRSIPISFKIRGGVRKAVLREAAASLGVPAEPVSAAKKAAQYSSGIQKIVASSRF